MEDPEGVDSLHRCGMCGSCGKQPWWAPEVLKELPPRERIRIKRRLEDGRRAFVAAREEAAAKKAAAEAASAALKAFAASKPTSSTPALPSPSGSFELGSSIAEPRSAPPPNPNTESNAVHIVPSGSPNSTISPNGLSLALPDEDVKNGSSTPGTSVLQAMKPKQEAGFGDENDASLEEISGDLKKMRESVLASFDSDIDSDDGSVAQSFHTPKGENVTPSETYYTPRTEDTSSSVSTAASKPEALALDVKPQVGPNGKQSASLDAPPKSVPGSSPTPSVRLTPVETPELVAERSNLSALTKEKVSIPENSDDLGTVSLASSPGIAAAPARVPVKEIKVPPLKAESKAGAGSEVVAKKCIWCVRSAERVRELELHIEALQCALKAREHVNGGKKSKRGQSAKGETQRLRDEVESLRLTVDFLFRKLQRYETSPRDEPEAH